MKEKTRTAFVITEDKAENYTKGEAYIRLCFVHQAWDEDLEQWIDQEEPRLSKAYKKIDAGENKPTLIDIELAYEMARCAELGLAFDGHRYE